MMLNLLWCDTWVCNWCVYANVHVYCCVFMHVCAEWVCVLCVFTCVWGCTCVCCNAYVDIREQLKEIGSNLLPCEVRPSWAAGSGACRKCSSLNLPLVLAVLGVQMCASASGSRDWTQVVRLVQKVHLPSEPSLCLWFCFFVSLRLKTLPCGKDPNHTVQWFALLSKQNSHITLKQIPF